MLAGSALHSVELVGAGSTARFLHQMELCDFIVSIGLQSLTLNMETSRPVDFRALALYLTQTVTLRDLCLGWSRHRRVSRQLTLACRANGSLVQLLLEGCPDENVLLESYCARNANLPTLLAGYRDGGSCVKCGNKALSLVPSLLVAAQQATRTAASISLLGLLALADSLNGGRSDTMRLRG
jgi:hypothetical protein